MLRTSGILLAVGLFSTLLIAASARAQDFPVRNWQTNVGVQMKGKFVRMNGAAVIVLSGNKPMALEYAALVPEDQKYVKEVLTKANAIAALPPCDTLRKWKDINGRSLDGAYVRVNDNQVILLTRFDGLKAFKFDSFSKEDRDYVRTMLAKFGEENLVQSQADDDKAEQAKLDRERMEKEATERAKKEAEEARAKQIAEEKALLDARKKAADDEAQRRRDEAEQRRREAEEQRRLNGPTVVVAPPPTGSAIPPPGSSSSSNPVGSPSRSPSGGSSSGPNAFDRAGVKMVILVVFYLALLILLGVWSAMSTVGLYGSSKLILDHRPLTFGEAAQLAALGATPVTVLYGFIVTILLMAEIIPHPAVNIGIGLVLLALALGFPIHLYCEQLHLELPRAFMLWVMQLIISLLVVVPVAIFTIRVMFSAMALNPFTFMFYRGA